MKTRTTLLLLTLLAAACGSNATGDGAGKDAYGGGSGDGTGDGSDPSDPASKDPAAQPTKLALVPGVAISEIALFQGVKVSIVKERALVEKTNAPVVAGRPGLVRVYVTTDASYAGQTVTAQLRISANGTNMPLLTDKKTLSGASTDDKIASTFNFDVPAGSLVTGATFSVALVDEQGEKAAIAGKASSAIFPQDGTQAPMGLVPTGKVKVVVVPLRYDADGSQRMPDISPSQLETYRTVMLSRYPASEVEVTARAAVSWTSAISPNGSGFSNALNSLIRLRQTDKAAADVYYFGVFAPASSMGQFCSQGCVAGLSGVGDNPSDTFVRASVGLGFTGAESASTMAHEIGHAHGRNHAPCGGAQGTDSKFPYSGGGIGVWGYDLSAKALISPTKGKDMMGYCKPEWISDYTYTALYNRIAFVNGVKSVISAPAVYRMISVDENGQTIDSSPITLDQEPGGELRDATFSDAAGVTQRAGKARFYPYDHLPGGIYVMPELPATITHVAVDGRRLAVR